MAKVLEQQTRDSVLDDRDCAAAAKAWAEFRRARPVPSTARSAERGFRAPRNR